MTHRLEETMAHHEIAVGIGTASPWVAKAVAAAIVVIAVGALAALVAAARLIWKGFRELPMI